MSIHATDQQGTPTGVAHVSTSKNLLNMQSDSNGEYLGTTSQQTYSGKNLLRPNNDSTAQGVSFVWNSDGTVTLNGTVTQAADMWIGNGNESADAFSIASGEKITCSYQIVSGTASSADFWKLRTILYYNGSAHWGDLTGNTTFTASSTTGVRGTEVLLLVGATFNNCTFKIQIEKSASATAFEPYVGGIPSPSPNYPQEIVTGKLASKNLFALGKTNGTTADVLYTYNSDGTFSLSGTASAGTGARSAPIPISESGLIPGEKYSFWCDHNVGWGSNSCVYYVQSCDSSGTWIANLMTFTSNSTATMPSTAAQYVMFVAAISNGSSYSDYNNVKAQLVAGEQVDNVFEPYFTPIELAEIGNYQDSVYKSGGSWYTHKELGKIVLDGTENWNGDWQNSGTPNYWQAYIKAVDFTSNYQVSGVDNTRCDHFVPSGTNSVWNFQGYGFALNPSATYTLQFKMPDTFIDNVADFKTWLGSNNTTAYYTLGTATDTAITDSATILWLNKYDTDALPHHKYVNTRRTTYVGASGLASAIDLYDGSYASTLPTYTTANDHNLTTANGGTYTVSLQNISASIISGTVTFSVFTNQRKIDFSWNGSATSTSVSVSLQADEYIKSIYAYIPQDADAGITLSQQLESGSLTDFEPYYNIVKIYAGNDLVFEDTSLTD